jgi:hypothetical protein
MILKKIFDSLFNAFHQMQRLNHQSVEEEFYRFMRFQNKE